MTRRVALALSALSLLACAKEQPFVVGSKQFTESELIGEMAAQIAEDMGIPVERKYYMGGMVCFESLKQNQMDLYGEYTGTGLVNILGEPSQSDPEAVFRRVSSVFKEKWGLTWLSPLGFNNTYALVMKRSKADAAGLKNISDLARAGKKFRCGFDLAFYDRPDGFPGMIRHYGGDFCSEILQMDPGLMYQALADGRVDVISGYGTDGRIKSLDLAALRDDKNFFPPYQAAYLAAPNAFNRAPGLKEKLELLAGRIDDAKMTELNAAVDAEKRPAAEVARRFLSSEGLISPADFASGAASRTFWGYFAQKKKGIYRLSLQHFAMVSGAMILGVLFGVPLGILLTRCKALSPYIMGVTTTLQTIPSVALLGLLMLLPVVGGIGLRPAVTALFLYSLLAIVENTYVGISQVDGNIIDAGRGMGMTDMQILRLIELPQALPVIIAGVRISAVICVATATIASYIGAGGLGDLIFRGVARANNAMVAWGAVPAILMSLAIHRLLSVLERRTQARANPQD